MNNQLPQARVLRIGMKKKRRGKKTLIASFTTLLASFLTAFVLSQSAQHSPAQEAHLPYAQNVSPLIQDGILLGNTYASLITQAEMNQTMIESKDWQLATSDAIRQMDRIVWDIGQMRAETEAEKIHQRHALKSYALYAGGMEQIRNGMMLHNDELIDRGRAFITEANSIIDMMDTTIPY